MEDYSVCLLGGWCGYGWVGVCEKGGWSRWEGIEGMGREVAMTMQLSLGWDGKRRFAHWKKSRRL